MCQLLHNLTLNLHFACPLNEMVKCANHYIIGPEVREIGSRHKILLQDDQALE